MFYYLIKYNSFIYYININNIKVNYKFNFNKINNKK